MSIFQYGSTNSIRYSGRNQQANYAVLLDNPTFFPGGGWIYMLIVPAEFTIEEADAARVLVL
jgi:hypothetical protein